MCALPAGHLMFTTDGLGVQHVWLQKSHLGTFYLNKTLSCYVFESLEGKVTSLESSLEEKAKEVLRQLILA